MPSKPDNFALIIGAMRCGTTSLFYYLSEHPEVAPCRAKEPHFFSDDEKFDRGLEWYHSLWDWQPSTHSIALEASPTYSMRPFWPSVPERVLRYDGEKTFRFIYIIRNPITRIESHIAHQLSGDNEITTSDVKEENMAYSKYAMQLEPYVEHFGRDRIHLVTLEDLSQHPQEELRKICKFLAIDSDYQFESVEVVRNSRDTVNLHPIIQRLRHLSPIRPLVQLIPPSVRQQLRKYLRRSDPFETTLSDEDLGMVLDYLQEDLQRLRSDWGINPHERWNIPQ